MNEWVCSFQQSFAREIHPEETQNHDKTCWTCFRHNLDFNFTTPSFSTVFPSFPTAFCPQYFLFVLVYFCSFHDDVFWCILLYLLFTYYTSIAFWKHAANAVTNNSTKTAFCGAMTVSQTCRNPVPPVSDDVALLRFGISFEIKPFPLLFTNPKTEKNQKTKTTKKRLRPQHQNPKMPRISWWHNDEKRQMAFRGNPFFRQTHTCTILYL